MRLSGRVLFLLTVLVGVQGVVAKAAVKTGRWQVTLPKLA